MPVTPVVIVNRVFDADMGNSPRNKNLVDQASILLGSFKRL